MPKYWQICFFLQHKKKALKNKISFVWLPLRASLTFRLLMKIMCFAVFFNYHFFCTKQLNINIVISQIQWWDVSYGLYEYVWSPLFWLRVRLEALGLAPECSTQQTRSRSLSQNRSFENTRWFHHFLWKPKQNGDRFIHIKYIILYTIEKTGAAGAQRVVAQ